MDYFHKESKGKHLMAFLPNPSHHNFMIKFGKPVFSCCLICLLLITLISCKRPLDEDGGYYDEKTRTYKYVKPKRRGFLDSPQQVYAPRPGETQTINGTVARIADDAKSVWIQINDRKPYMILASSLSGNSRNDKDKQFLLNLSYVSPASSVKGSRKFRQQWKKYVIQVLKNELLNRKVLVEFNYAERSRRFFGNLYQTVNSTKGSYTRDINMWMIQRGLSFYFVDRDKSPRDKEYVQAQNLARKTKQGVWKY